MAPLHSSLRARQDKRPGDPVWRWEWRAGNGNKRGSENGRKRKKGIGGATQHPPTPKPKIKNPPGRNTTAIAAETESKSLPPHMRRTN